MPHQITLVLTPRQAAEPETYTAFAARRLGIKDTDIALARVVKRSIDARQRQVKVNLTLEVFVDREPLPAPVHFDYPNVEGHTEVVIVGSGPAGLFAALRLIELGLRPVILERGRDVSSRKRDIALINRNERSFSSSVTAKPRLARMTAHSKPPGPPPTTTTGRLLPFFWRSCQR